MRLFGNAINRIIETARPPEPEVGMLATLLAYSDRTPAKVKRILKYTPDGRATQVELVRLVYRITGMEGYGTVTEPHEEHGTEIATLSVRRDGTAAWFTRGGRTNGNGVSFGKAEVYHDRSF
jgi:hypothetical protein